jgi:hypothetical protein
MVRPHSGRLEEAGCRLERDFSASACLAGKMNFKNRRSKMETLGLIVRCPPIYLPGVSF